MTVGFFNKVATEFENSDKKVSVSDVAELMHDLFHEAQQYIADACVGVVVDKFTNTLRAIEARGE